MTGDGAERLRARLAAGGVVGGPIMVSANAGAVEIAAEAGFDMVTIDTEEASTSPFGPELAAQVAAGRAAGCPVLVRVVENRADMIAAALAVGADGIWVPHLEDRAGAEALVAGCAARSGAPALSVAIVESMLGLDRAEEIALTAGLDIVCLGPFDLGVDMGLPPERILGAGDEWLGAEMRAAAERVLAACAAGSAVPATLAWSGESAAGSVAMGFRFLLFGIDTMMVGEAAGDRRAEVAGAIAGAGATL